jgi:acetate kinase
VTAPDGDIVLALNSGSSSLKFGIYAVGRGDPVAVFVGEIEGAPGDRTTLDRVAEALDGAAAPAPTMVGHRIVHGGPALRRHCRIDVGVIANLKAAIPFAPLHGPASLALIEAARVRYPNLPQVACFDTVFHATLPPVAHVLPLPKVLQKDGIRRYGFHGLSCESIVRQLGDPLPDRLVIAHLGNGASVTAVQAGRSIDTSMGLTPSGGVMMGTRSGDIDPGVLVHLLRSHDMDASSLEDIIDRQSGMLGVSSLSGDMRRLHEASAPDADARLAIEMFCYSVRKQIAGMIAVLDGIDMIAFTGGIGENDAVVRNRICGGLAWAGVAARADHERTSAAGCEVRVVASREDEQIARHSHEILRTGPDVIATVGAPPAI